MTSYCKLSSAPNYRQQVHRSVLKIPIVFGNKVIYCVFCVALGTKPFLKVKYLDLISEKLSVSVKVADLLAVLQGLMVSSRMGFWFETESADGTRLWNL